MLASFLVSFTSFIFGNIYIINGNPSYFFGLEPLYPGLFTGLTVYVLGLFLKRKFNR
jgi:hypothetical protein